MVRSYRAMRRRAPQTLICVTACWLGLACAGDRDVAARATSAPRPLSSPGLALGYSFDEGLGTTVRDVSSNNVKGTLSRDSLWSAGKFGKGLVLDADNAFVDVGAPAVARATGSLTVSAWIKPSAHPTDDAALVSTRGTDEAGFQLDTTADKGARTVGFKLTGASGANIFRYGATELDLGNWHHVAGIYDAEAKTVHVYLDGKLDDGSLDGTVEDGQTSSIYNLTIGKRPGKDGFGLLGNLDEVRLYTRALSEAELQADMAAAVQDGEGSATPSSSMPKFQNEILATGFTLPTCVKFLPDGRMLLVELAGKIKALDAPYTQADPTPFLQLTNVGSAGVQQGIYDLAFDPKFSDNHYYYIFYTAGSPNHDRLSRFTANAMLTGTEQGSERILYEDSHGANAEHHGGGVTFGNDGMIYFTTGEAFQPEASPKLDDPRGKIHRIRSDGSVPEDNPFYDGDGSNVDSIWAIGMRNPYRAYYDKPTDRMFIGDVGGNDNDTAIEEVNIAVRGGNFGWPDCEGTRCGGQNGVGPIHTWSHDGRDACVTGGFVYHGQQFPRDYEGNYFFADYTQNWIKRMTFDANGGVDQIKNFEPLDGRLDGPFGDIVYLTEGPEGALYYVDLGYSDVGATFGTSKVRRIRYVTPEEAPVAMASGTPLTGHTPVTVQFSSEGSEDPSGKTLQYAWNFGDGSKSTDASPAHTYEKPGRFTVRLTVSNGVGSTIAPPIIVTAGDPPVAKITEPKDGLHFVAGDVIKFSGVGTNVNGTLPDSAYTWNVDFLHGGHVHPSYEKKMAKDGSYEILAGGHDYSGDTRYRIQLTVTDEAGLSSVDSVIVWPTKVDLSFETEPSGLTLYLDGIAKTTPFKYDSVPNFVHTVEARDMMAGASSYHFKSWSDGGTQRHTITVKADGGQYKASFAADEMPEPTSDLVGAWSFNEGSGEQARDATGSDNAVKLSGGANWRPGKYGSSLALAGGAASVAHAKALDLAGSFSLAAWVNPKELKGYQTILMKESMTDSTGYCGYWLQSNGTVLSGGFNVDGTCVEHAAPAELPTDTWSHVAAVFDDDADTFTLYLNGKAVDTQPETSKPTLNQAPLTFGRSLFGEAWTGLLDEVHIYRRALSDREIADDMNVAQ